jgi:hypothetical protein
MDDVGAVIIGVDAMLSRCQSQSGMSLSKSRGPRQVDSANCGNIFRSEMGEASRLERVFIFCLYS